MSKIHKELKKLDIKKTTQLKRDTDLNRELSVAKTQMTEKHLKKCSAFLAIREIKIKTTLRFRVTPIKTTKICKTSYSSC